jgi:ERCC4-type nuclease
MELKERVPILTTADKEQTALVLKVLWKSQDKGAPEYGLRHKPKALSLGQRQRFLVEGLPSIGETLARNLLERFGTVRAVFDASAEELEHTPKIGAVKAAEIVRLVNAAYEGEQTHLEGEASDDED